MILAPLRLPESEVIWRGLRLMVHQARALELATSPALLIEAPTGGGKTWTAAAPLLDAAALGEGAFFVYPTNALADDQALALFSLAERAGLHAAIVQPDGSWRAPAPASVLVCRVHAGVLDDVRAELGGRFRGQQLSRLLKRLPPKPLWFITNPDSLFLLLTAQYALSPQIWSRLEHCRTLVFDEFHLYRGPTLVRALVLMKLAQLLTGVDRIRILSATLPTATRELLEEQLGFIRIEARPSSNGYIVQHEVQLHVEAADAERTTARMAEIIGGEIAALRTEAKANVRVPLVALRTSVMGAIELEDTLAPRTVSHEEIGIYRGLSSRAIRIMAGKVFVVGTSALEVGVDFDTTRLLFEAASASSFVQRLGRVARHRPGNAHFFTNARIAGVLGGLEGQLSREQLLQQIHSVFGDDVDLSNFTFSPWGAAIARGAFSALASFALKCDAQNLAALIADAEAQFSSIFARDQQLAAGGLSRAVRRALRSNLSFRGSSGSVEVFDVNERARRGSAELACYDVDLETFYRRARWRDPLPGRTRPVILGWGSPRNVSVTLNGMTFDTVGLHAPRGDQIELRIDGSSTVWESLLREQPHIVGLYPRVLRTLVSWRETCFDSDHERVALLDDDALVAAYLWSSAISPHHGIDGGCAE